MEVTYHTAEYGIYYKTLPPVIGAVVVRHQYLQYIRWRQSIRFITKQKLISFIYIV